MKTRNFSGILTTGNDKGIKIQFPISDTEFKKLLGNITNGDMEKPFYIKNLTVNHVAEAKCLSESQDISSINYYCALIEGLSDAEYNMLRFLLDAGFNAKNVDELINPVLNLGNYAFADGIPDAYALGKKILEVNAKDGKIASNFNNKEKITWLGEFVRAKSDGRFHEGIYIESTENFQLFFDGPADIPEEYCSSVPLWDDETK